MTKFARIIDGIAVDVTAADPSGLYHPDVASQFVSVPAQVERGWRKQGSTWSAPEAPAETPATAVPRRTVFTPPEFLLLFTAAERVAIRAARPTNPVISDWLTILEDPRLSEVDVTRQSTRDGLEYLAAENLITPARAAEIGTGAPL
ncbi:hypothetical protein [Pannonibacter sp. SL95]|uniref:hypothetical protein n=1 Tax=Pannonibacter sp. SL95 TaxID=2995153 RepID=UPI002272DBA3|nr:hypothetical protein [Pannonibacter sp. SL95]MCY1705476.1 hypothetical protein [Pannonibacter sp. SL95]